MNIKNPKINLNPTDKAFVRVADKNSIVSQFTRQSEWSFRIYAQMLHRSDMGYAVYFFTLTYNDKFLPRFSFKNYSCPCFDREHIRRFVRGVQMDLLKKYKITDYDYIICCEFGKSATFRPHLHGCFMIPNTISAQDVHDLIKKHWSVLTGRHTKSGLPIRESLGWVLPAKCYGGMDSKGHYHKPILVDPKNLDSAAIYVSKYCTKQLDFFNNKDVVKVKKLVEKYGTLAEKRNFSRSCPFIKVSQHFGECIKEWIFGQNLPKSGVIQVSSNSFENLLKGIWTPLCRKSTTKIPFYIVRKLMYDKVEEQVERYLEYTEQEWYSYDIFTADDVFKGLRPLVKANKLKYTYITQYSDFWLEYSAYELKERLNEKKYDIEYYLSLLDEPHFVEYRKTLGINEELLQKKTSLSAEMLALYAVVYRDRYSPLHYFALSQNSGLFENSLEVVDKQIVRNKPVSYRYRRACGFDDFQIDEYVFETYENDYFNYVSTFVETDFEMSLMLEEIGIIPPFFSGRETLQQMKENAEKFFLSRLAYIQQRNDTSIKIQYNALFNSFPCFRGFDFVLNVIDDYKQFCSENKIKRVQKTYHEKKDAKDLLFN